jgi:glucose-6-phosphate 1-dehydrogenase
MRELRLARQGKRKPTPRVDDNPLREGLRLERVPDPSCLVLFGATGDLAHRKVVPALYQLWRTNLLPHDFVILAIGRRDYEDDALRAEFRASADKYSRVLPIDETAWRGFAARIRYQKLDFANPADYEVATGTLSLASLSAGESAKVLGFDARPVLTIDVSAGN